MGKPSPVIKLRKPSRPTPVAVAESFVNGADGAAGAAAAVEHRVPVPVVEQPTLPVQVPNLSRPPVTAHVVEAPPAPMLAAPQHTHVHPASPTHAHGPAPASTHVHAPAPAPTHVHAPLPEQAHVHSPPSYYQQPSSPRPSADEYQMVPRRRTVVTRKDGRSLHRTTVYLTPDLSKRVAIRCVEENRTQSELIAAALSAYLH